MEEEENKKLDVLDDDLDEDQLSLKSGDNRPLSHTINRPPSKPAPSARVRALNKVDVEDVDQHTGEEDEEEDDEDDEDEDEDQGIQIEGENSFRIIKSQYHYNYKNHYGGKKLLNHRRFENRTVYSDNETDNSSPIYDNENESNYDFYNGNRFIPLDEEEEQEKRDKYYLSLPFTHRRAYDPADFENLPVSKEVKDIFQYITRYTPQNIDLDTKLRPFIPEFIPAVGDIDAFIKVPRPDGVTDKLGLSVLDEPCAKQTDPTVLDLQLRAISKETSFKSAAVKNLENADKHPKEIDAWIESISNLHRSKPPPTVHYSRNMPDIETLMQEWPPDFEQILNEVGLPSADLDCSLEEYVNLICGIMDIPVYRSKIQSLHVLFSLFLEFKNSQHFRSLAMNNDIENTSKTGEADRLVIRDD